MRLGLIGCGNVGQLRAAAVTQLAGFRLVAVADVDSDRCRAIAVKFEAVPELDWKILVQREDLDAVIISTPPPLHVEMCIRAFESGKHVLCEKPLGRSPTECYEILRAAERNKRVLATGFNYRFYPAITKAREILNSGLIGEMDHIRSYAGHPGGREFTHPWVHDVSVMGGGTLLDNGIHIIDLTYHFLGEVVEVKGYVTGNVWQFPGCEDNGFALLKNPAGKVALLQASWSEWRGYRFWIEVYGTHGCVRASYPPMLTKVVWVDRPGGRPQRRIHFFPILQVVERLRSFRWTGLQSFKKELTAFSQAIGGEKTPLAVGRDGAKSVEIAHAVYRSSQNGMSVPLDDSMSLSETKSQKLSVG